MADSRHWDEVYEAKGDRTSWFRPHLDRSLAIIDRLGLPAGATAIDDLLERGLGEVTLVDLSEVALERTRARLGERAERVRFVVGDITRVELPENAYDLWHDRAVFHFLTDPDVRAAYVRQVVRALRPGGFVVVATFGLHGPEQCSGLPVVRYDDRSLHATFGEEAFRKLGSERELHATPWGTEQEFVYCYCRCESC